jgi:hypothetical protein
VLLKLAKEAIFERLGAASGMTVSPGYVRHNIVEPVLGSLHDDHIDKATDWDRANGYSLSLLVAIRDRGKAVLYETDRRACAEVQAFACVGSGAPVGNYVASTTFMSQLESGWAEISAAYVIQQAKAYGDDCGGDTNIVVVPNAGRVTELSPERVRKREQAAVSIHEALGNVLAANATNADDDDVRTFSVLRDVVFGVGNELAGESGRPTRVVKHTFIHFRQQLPDQEDQPTPTLPKRGRKGRKPSRA